MLRGQVCSSKGKRARNMGQEQIKDTLQFDMVMIKVIKVMKVMIKDTLQFKNGDDHRAEEEMQQKKGWLNSK